MKNKYELTDYVCARRGSRTHRSCQLIYVFSASYSNGTPRRGLVAVLFPPVIGLWPWPLAFAI